MISRRITEPSSILRSFISQKEYIESQEVSKNTFYRTLDFVAENQNTLLQKLNEMVLKKQIEARVKFILIQQLFILKPLKEKVTRKMVILRMVNFKEDQIVIGFSLWSKWNTISHQKYIVEIQMILEHLSLLFLEVQKTYNVNDLTVVIDRGMSINSNIRFLEQKGFKFVISYRARKGVKKFKELLLEKSGYIQLNNDVVYKEEIAISTFHKKRPNGHLRRKIITYSIKRFKKDKVDRDKMIEDFQKKLDKNGYMDSSKMISSYKCQFFRQVSNLKFELDVDKVNRHKEFDGIYVYETNLMDEKVDKIMNIYKNQWKIEENFRSLKTYLEIRHCLCLSWRTYHRTYVNMFCIISNIEISCLSFQRISYENRYFIWNNRRKKLINLISNVLDFKQSWYIHKWSYRKYKKRKLQDLISKKVEHFFNDYCETVRKIIKKFVFAYV
ncbi:IS1634 family transposase [Mycoplasma sp. 6243]|uniref:IS1634 family transposase n=1 Tax=Mycoplasma sp. 6243 TaxID=3440865 RepID=UPI003EBB41DC